ncbi:hypothetical protein ILYODFUR_013293 [Ilyodon furcidens]|uniref:Uncharacterized protein n=1 Tax=Ilyodon furcidens TaxID=33524 RepID=A0ABV0V699_9TELE
MCYFSGWPTHLQPNHTQGVCVHHWQRYSSVISMSLLKWNCEGKKRKESRQMTNGMKGGKNKTRSRKKVDSKGVSRSLLRVRKRQTGT